MTRAYTFCHHDVFELAGFCGVGEDKLHEADD